MNSQGRIPATVSRVILAGAVMAVVCIGRPARAADAKAASGIFWDDGTVTAGGSATDTNASDWSLGENTATAGGCSDIKAQINGKKKDILGSTVSLVASCTGTSCKANATSTLTVVAAATAGFYTVTPQASATATSSGTFHCGARANARYSDPMVFINVPKDFVLLRNFKMLAGSTFFAGPGSTLARHTSAYASNFPGLEELLKIEIYLDNNSAGLQVTVSKSASARVTLLDPVSGSPLTLAQAEDSIKAAFAFNFLTSAWEAATTADLFTLKVDFSTVSALGTVSVSVEGENFAEADGGLIPPTQVPAASPAVVLALVGGMLYLGIRTVRRGQSRATRAS